MRGSKTNMIVNIIPSIIITFREALESAGIIAVVKHGS